MTVRAVAAPATAVVLSAGTEMLSVITASMPLALPACAARVRCAGSRLSSFAGREGTGEGMRPPTELSKSMLTRSSVLTG